MLWIVDAHRDGTRFIVRADDAKIVLADPSGKERIRLSVESSWHRKVRDTECQRKTRVQRAVVMHRQGLTGDAAKRADRPYPTFEYMRTSLLTRAVADLESR